MEKKEQTISREPVNDKLISRFRHLLNDFKSGIPEEVKHSTSPDSGWKVQKFWFLLVSRELNRILRQSITGQIAIPQELFDEIRNYHDELVNNDSFKRRLTTQEDINKAERIINKVITELEDQK